MNYEFKGTKDKWELARFNSIQAHPTDPLKMSIICVAYGDGEEMEANRHLIAAAPDMLEALKETLNCGLPEDVELQVKQAIHKALNIQP